ncbi:hypothetical protein [Gluconacetobacter diazotrophicus]|uniref:hypothetical protein n=1 Tax=Gluconacetobacter diazotrophicus TaxID=33996 RepID=UPI0011A6BF1A|nr:hypothetical protein [Gluconacetobacter diazotrophicus]
MTRNIVLSEMDLIHSQKWTIERLYINANRIHVQFDMGMKFGPISWSSDVGFDCDISYQSLHDLISYKHANQNINNYRNIINVFLNDLKSHIGCTFSGGYTLMQNDLDNLDKIKP